MLKYSPYLFFIILFTFCGGPPKKIDFPDNASEYPQPKTKSIKVSLPVAAKWQASTKGKTTPRVLSTFIEPFDGPAFDFTSSHSLTASIDSNLIRLEELPSVAMDLEKFVPKKIKPQLILLGKPKKVKAGVPVAEDQFTKGLLQLGHDQGIPGNGVIGMAQDKNGKLWMSTENGLCVFDGEFIYTWLKKQGLSRDRKHSLCIDKKGHIWAAGGGVDEIIPEEGIVKHYGKEEGLLSNAVSSVSESREGKIYITSMDGIDIYDPIKETIIHMTQTQGLSAKFVNAVTEDKYGKLWLATNGGGVDIYDPVKKRLYFLKHEQGLSNDDIRAIISDKQGNIWMGGWYGGVDIYNEESGLFYHLALKHGLAFNYIHAIIQDHKGLMWIAYLEGGVDTYDPVHRKLHHVFGKPGISKSTVPALLEDKEHCIWMGSEATGVLKYDPSNGNLSNYNNTYWYTKRPIIEMMEDDEGNIWLCSSGAGMDIYKPASQSLVHVNTLKDWTDAWQNQLVDDHKGHIYMCTHYRFNIYDKKTGTLTSWNKEGLINEEIQCLELYNDEVILGSKVGLDKYDPVTSTFLHLDAPADACKNNVLCMTKDNNNCIWVGTASEGVYKFDPKKQLLTHYGKEQGFSNNPVYCLLADYHGSIWVATGGDGLKKLDPERNTVTTITTEEGLSEMTVVSLIEKDKRLYAGTVNGLSIIEDSNKKINVTALGKPQGFRTSDFNYGSALLTKDGTIVWGIGEVLSVYNPRDKNSATEETAITGIDIMGKEIDFSDLIQHVNIPAKDSIWSSTRDTFYFQSNVYTDTGYIHKNNIRLREIKGAYHIPEGLELPYDQNHMTFHFTGNYLNNTDKSRYRYVLEGLETKWNPVVNESFADYRNLLPGNYTFKVSSSNYGGPWSKPSEFSFKVVPPFWKTTVAYVFYALILVGLVIAYNRINTSLLRKRQKELESVVKERTSEIVEQKNEIEIQKQTVEEKQKEIVDSINYAKRIQYELLAHEKTLQQHFSEHFVLFQPKDIVSGDFYWATKKIIDSTTERFYLAVCDSTGHGVPGAFMSLLNINFLNEAINEKNILQPDAILNYVRERLIESISRNGGQDGMDGILFCFEYQVSAINQRHIKNISYAAANNRPLLYRNETLTELEANKMPIGKGEKEEPFSLQVIQPQKGDIIYLYTDGFADQFGGPKGKKFKYKQLNDILLNHATQSMEQQLSVLSQSINSWKGGLEQVDDICVMGIKL